MNLKNILFPSKEERMQKAMRNLNETTSQIKKEGDLENPNQYFMNRLRKQYVNQERRAIKLGGNLEMIYQYRNTAEEYVIL